MHKMPRVHKWTCLRGSEWTPFVDAFFMQQRAETRHLNSKWTAFYYNSVLIIRLCIWHSESKSLILLLFVLLAMRAEEIITVVAYYNERLLLQRNSTKYISYEINNSSPIYTIYKEAKIFEITCNLPDRKINPVFACVNLSLFKDLNPCSHAPLSVTDYEKWNLKL